MKGVEALVIIVVVLLLVAGGIAALKAATANDDRKGNRFIRRIAGTAPELLPDNPLSEVILEQRQLLDAANQAMTGLLRDDVNVFLPSYHSDALRNWQAEYAESRKRLTK